jgi:hypothetical protein
MADQRFEAEGFTITVSPRSDGLVFVYLDTEEETIHDRLRVRINEESLIGLTEAAGWIGNEDQRAEFVLSFLDPIPDDEEDIADAKRRLEELRSSVRAESISWGELAELQGLARFIDPSDTELLEWAGVPEHKDEENS